jgi:hypothetical protein
VVGEHCGEATFIKDNISGMNGLSNSRGRKDLDWYRLCDDEQISARVLTGWPSDTEKSTRKAPEKHPDDGNKDGNSLVCSMDLARNWQPQPLCGWRMEPLGDRPLLYRC